MIGPVILWATLVCTPALALAQAQPGVTGTPRDTASVHDPADLRPEAPLPPDAMVPGAPGVTAILCEADPAPLDASGALGLPAEATRGMSPGAPRVVRIENPWAAAPVMTGAGDPVPVTFFKRGRTLIFDAQSEVLYLERDHRRFTYTRSTGAVTTWRGICRVDP